MKWKTLFGRCIYQGPEGIRVFENFCYRWLKFDSDALQTLLNKKNPARIGLNYINQLIFMVLENPGNCALLGLGGANIIHALHKQLVDYQLLAVEQSAEIITLASDFFYLTKRNHLQIVHSDAHEFVYQSTLKFKHLLVDLFDAHHFPQHCNNQAFFAQCKRLLCNEGILAVNLANQQEQKKIFHLIREEFAGNTIILPVQGCANIIVIAGQKEIITQSLQRLKTHLTTQQLTWDANWGYVAQIKRRC